MYKITVSDKCMKLFAFEQEEVRLQSLYVPSNFGFPKPMHAWEDLEFKNLDPTFTLCIELGEPVTLKIEGDTLYECLVKGYLKKCTVIPTTFEADFIFGVTNVILEAKNDYIAAYDRAMAIIGKR